MSKVQGSVRPARARPPGSMARPAKKKAKPAAISTTPAPAVSAAKATSGGLVRMGELARLSGVPSSTIKHYLREGLLPGKSVSIARNSALYDRSLVEQIRHIKDLQTTSFLPLWRIKEVLAGTADVATATVVAAVDRVLEAGAPRSARLQDVMARGLTREEHGFLVERGLIDGGERLVGDDLALCETVIRARAGGLTERLPIFTMLDRYRLQIEHLVATEIELFQVGIVAGAGPSLAASTVEAMKVSERLVLLLRRRLLLPLFERVASAPAKKKPAHTTVTATTKKTKATKAKPVAAKAATARAATTKARR